MHQYRVDAARQTVFFTAGTTLAAPDFLRVILEIIEEPDFEPGFSHLADLRAVTDIAATGEQVRQRAELDRRLVERLGNAKMAVVSASDAVFGISRIYQTMMEGTPVEVATFRDMDEAREWLGLPPEGAREPKGASAPPSAD